MNKSSIVLSGLCYDNNLGDNAITYSTEEMVKEILGKYCDTLPDFYHLDFNGRKGVGEYYKLSYEIIFRIMRKITRIILKREPDILNRIHIRLIIKDLCRKMINSHTKAVIFVGGGLIKYKQQQFYDQIYIITKYANRKNVPVMFSAVGIEGFDEKDKRCLKLKKALNLDCVKAITTRDDIDMLKDNYCTKSICLEKVADPACSLNKYLKLKVAKRNTDGKKCIGLGVLRKNIFSDYEIDFSNEDMLLLYKQLYFEIIENGYECRFFCNGAISDERFAKELTASLNLKEKDVCVPRPVTVKQLAEIISGFDGVIVGRLHASIIAYSYDIPCVGIVWNNKQIMFAETVGKEKDFFTVDRFDAHNMVSSLIERIDGPEIDSEKKEKFCNTTISYLEKFLTEIDLY